MRERREQQNLVRHHGETLLAASTLTVDEVRLHYVHARDSDWSLNFRLSPEQEQALRHAAALTGQSLLGAPSAAVDHAHDFGLANRTSCPRSLSAASSLRSTSPTRRLPNWCASPDGRAAFPPIEHPALGPVELCTRTGTTSARFSSDVAFRPSVAESRPSRLPPARPLRGWSSRPACCLTRSPWGASSGSVPSGTGPGPTRPDPSTVLARLALESAGARHRSW